VICPAQSTDKAIPICTSVGFRSLTAEDYLQASSSLRADVVISMADIADTDTISRKRREKMVDRTHSWFTEAASELAPTKARTQLYASILPLDNVQQQLYLSDLADDESPSGGPAGLALYEPEAAATLPAELSEHARFCISNPSTPQDVLRAVLFGADLVTTPFVTATTERGIAFTFKFPPAQSSDHQPLGIDMWSTSHATSVTALSPGCPCYTCKRHHRAYLHHLLQAKEMLAWTLLQVHNFHVLDELFASIRHSLDAATFERDANAFIACYAGAFPAGEGEDRGPRMRGYQMKSAGRGEDQKRAKAWGRFEDPSAAASGTESPVAIGVENDQARKVSEAIEGGGEAQLDLTGDDFEHLGLAEKVKD
jgi:queuine tRNA-ribosyltransferase accessory subunit